jgi:mRNA interferase RelE/StbE
VSYAITVKPRAIRGLSDLPTAVAERLRAEISSLSDDPRAGDVKLLKGDLRGIYRRRVGAYRILYTVDDAAGVVDIVGVGHRSRIYG